MERFLEKSSPVDVDFFTLPDSFCCPEAESKVVVDFFYRFHLRASLFNKIYRLPNKVMRRFRKIAKKSLMTTFDMNWNAFHN